MYGLNVSTLTELSDCSIEITAKINLLCPEAIKA
jgi:hypothetical protein